MTEFNNINKFISNTPKTYEVRYLEQSNLSTVASYLGINTAECSGEGQVIKTADDAAKVVAATAKSQAEVAAKEGGTSTITLETSGKVTIQYQKGAKKS